MDWAAASIGLGGLALAALTVYLDYKKRIAPYRELLYAKQIEGYAQVINALNDWFDSAQDCIAVRGCRLDDSSRVELRKETVAQNMAFHTVYRSWALYLPKAVDVQISAFVKVFNAISAPPDVARQYPADQVYAKDPGMLLANAYTGVFQSMRKSMGTEPLTQATLKIVGQVLDERRLDNRSAKGD